MLARLVITNGKLPKAISEIIPLDQARAKFDELVKAGTWQGQAYRPILQIRDDSNRVLAQHPAPAAPVDADAFAEPVGDQPEADTETTGRKRK